MSGPQTEPSALPLLTDAETAAVLDELMADDVELERRAEQAGRRLLATVTTAHVASAVADALLALDQEDLAAHAGRTRYGYVEPTEAAWRLLEQALEPWLEDLARRASLGLEKAARQLGLGILEGLGAVGDHINDDERLLSWAPDFTGEAADSVLRALTDVGIELTHRCGLCAGDRPRLSSTRRSVRPGTVDRLGSGARFPGADHLSARVVAVSESIRRSAGPCLADQPDKTCGPADALFAKQPTLVG